MKIGNIVQWNYNGRVGEGYCVGEMRYSTDKGKVICIATEEHLGMPVGLKWCRVAEEGDLKKALELRRRYDARLPGHMKEIKRKAAA